MEVRFLSGRLRLWVERVAKEKYSSLFRPVNGDEENNFITSIPGVKCYTTFSLVANASEKIS